MRQWIGRNRLFFLLVGLLLLISLPILTYPLGRDQGEFATIGRGLLYGRIPYIDLWNPKPPAVFYVYAAAMALFGQTTPALRAIDLLLIPFVLAGIYALGSRLYCRMVGLWAALLFGVFYFTESFWTLTQNDGIVLFPMVLGMLCAVRAADEGKRHALWALGAGVLMGWAVWFKYPFAVFAGVAALSYLLLRLNQRLRVRWQDGIAFGVGLVAVIGGGIAVMKVLGAWDALLESATVTSAYTALGFNWADFSEAMRIALGFRWSQWGLLFVLAAVGVGIAFLVSPRSQSDSETKGVPSIARWVLILWLGAGLVVMLVQAKGYDYHWLPMLPPLALLGAVAIDRILLVVSRRLPSLRHAVSVLAAVGLISILVVTIWSRALPYLTGQEDQLAYYAHFQGGEFVADESQRVADFLKARVSPGDSLYIWGFRPEVYYLSRLNPPTRFIFQFPLVASWYPPEWQEENVDILWAALPPYVLILQVDYMPWVTGSHEDSNTLLQSYTELNNWLVYNYEPETQIGNFIVWRRKS